MPARWEGDNRGRGIADAAQLVPGASELVASLMRGHPTLGALLVGGVLALSGGSAAMAASTGTTGPPNPASALSRSLR
jgi:hypothetical protein